MRNPLPEIDLHLGVQKYDQKFFQEQVKMQTISVSKCKKAPPNKLLIPLKLLSLPLLLELHKKWHIFLHLCICMLLYLEMVKAFKNGLRERFGVRVGWERVGWVIPGT